MQIITPDLPDSQSYCENQMRFKKLTKFMLLSCRSYFHYSISCMYQLLGQVIHSTILTVVSEHESCYNCFYIFLQTNKKRYAGALWLMKADYRKFPLFLCLTILGKNKRKKERKTFMEARKWLPPNTGKRIHQISCNVRQVRIGGTKTFLFGHQGS